MSPYYMRERQTDRQSKRDRDRETERQRERETERGSERKGYYSHFLHSRALLLRRRCTIAVNVSGWQAWRSSVISVVESVLATMSAPAEAATMALTDEELEMRNSIRS